MIRPLLLSTVVILLAAILYNQRKIVNYVNQVEKSNQDSKDDAAAKIAAHAQNIQDKSSEAVNKVKVLKGKIDALEKKSNEGKGGKDTLDFKDIDSLIANLEKLHEEMENEVELMDKSIALPSIDDVVPSGDSKADNIQIGHITALSDMKKAKDSADAKLKEVKSEMDEMDKLFNLVFNSPKNDIKVDSSNIDEQIGDFLEGLTELDGEIENLVRDIGERGALLSEKCSPEFAKNNKEAVEIFSNIKFSVGEHRRSLEEFQRVYIFDNKHVFNPTEEQKKETFDKIRNEWQRIVELYEGKASRELRDTYINTFVTAMFC